MKKMKWRGVFLFAILLFCFVSFSQDSDFNTEENVVFQSGFEEGNKLLWDDWDENPDTENQIISDPGPFNKEGNHVIRLAVASGQAGGSDLIKVLPSQYDSLYVRWYIKYESGFNFKAPNHGGGLFAGDRSFLGQSDHRPDGENFAIATIEYNTSMRTTQVYSYYRGMYQDCANPVGACWGDVFPCTSDEGAVYCTKKDDRDPPLPPALTAGQWYCMEMKYKLGTPSLDASQADGEISLWVDGHNYGLWDELWVRKNANLKLGILWLSLYHHDGSHSDAGVLMDNVVVSKEPIGLLNSLEVKYGNVALKVYPNPANSMVTVQLSAYKDFSVLLYDIYGRLLLSKSMVGMEGNLHIDNLGHGIYNILIRDNKDNSSIASSRLVYR